MSGPRTSQFGVMWLACSVPVLLVASPQAQGQQPRVDPIVKSIDSDSDGAIDPAELQSAAVSLRKLDANRDGMISREEGFPDGVRGQQRDGRGGSGSQLGGYTTPPPANHVPPHTFDIILGRLSGHCVTVRVMFYGDTKAFLSYGKEKEKHSDKTEPVELHVAAPHDFVIDSLDTNTRYYYRLHYDSDGAGPRQSEEYTFHTQRGPGSPFVFTVQADSHLDENTSGDVFLQTLSNALASHPDFHFALGDTFMTGKYVRPELSRPQYLAQRYYLGHLCHSAALYFALGNHDGESGNRGSNTWATIARKRVFPNPFPNQFFTGNQQSEPQIGLPENYYEFQWGDCQFIVLDPFRHTTSRTRGGETSVGNWYWTLGNDQYEWLRQALETSQAKLRFVFLHHLVGGSDRNQRGGSEAAPFWEWGGKSRSGEYEFDQYRPSWSKPIHDLLVEHGVSVVFHGHDHMFIKQDLDGIVYQLVPQPGHPRFGNTRSAGEYGYLTGEIQSSSGHVRVRVDGDQARVDYVRTYLPSSEGDGRVNGEVSYSYQLSPGASR